MDRSCVIYIYEKEFDMEYQNIIQNLEYGEYRTYIGVGNEFESFVKFEVVRNVEDILRRINAYGIESTDMPMKPEDFISSYMKYEEEHKRKFMNSEYKARQGVHLIALLPMNLSNVNISKLVQRFVDSIRGIEKRLYYVSWIEHLGIAAYAHIYICDREWYTSKIEYYTRDYYQSSVTGRMCQSSDEDAVLIAKKGSVKKHIFSSFTSAKSRLFIYKDEQKKEFLERFLIYWKQAIISLCLVEHGKFKFQRKRFGELTDKYTKRAKIAMNRLQIYIENILNQMWNMKERTYADIYDVYRFGAKYGEEQETNFDKKLNKLFQKYRQRFLKEAFHENEELFLMKGRINIVEANIELLKSIFDKEVLCLVEADKKNEVMMA